MTRNDAYLIVVEGWLRDNRGIVFTEGAVDDLCDRIASMCFAKARDNARLRALVKDLADDLEAEVKGRNPAETLQYPSEQRRYERDMVNVYEARRALESKS